MKKFLSTVLNIVLSAFSSVLGSLIYGVFITKDLKISEILSGKLIQYFLLTGYKVIIVVILLIIVGLVLHRYLVRCGERGTPVRPYTFIQKYLKIISIIIELHDFQHFFSKAYLEIRKQDTSSESFRGVGLYALTELLRKVQSIIRLAIGADVSLNIKAFVKINKTENEEKTPAKNTYLRVLVRVPSNHELKCTQENKHEERRDSFKYFIGSGRDHFKRIKNNAPQTMKKWMTETVNPLKDKIKDRDETFLVNSAYLYILGDKQHYFISNNLEKDEKDGLYLGNCDDWKDFYKSKAVFLISPNMKPNVPVDMKLPIGILVVDSKKKFIFETRFIRKLVGYFAHRLYDILKYYRDTITSAEHYD